MDNEGKVSVTWDYIWLYGGGAPEPATMSLLAVGGLALLRRRSR
ncbi:MAG: PEP-CTERM sorting domain-containing protein [Phycisphaerae bacterium]|nr:PEP-CTERM sorting domain-containing protein [Phycisphaerae bacterium]